MGPESLQPGGDDVLHRPLVRCGVQVGRQHPEGLVMVTAEPVEEEDGRAIALDDVPDHWLTGHD
ncbi:MAG: hypothetical protein ABW156_01840 [Jiangellaceae bacterium]